MEFQPFRGCSALFTARYYFTPEMMQVVVDELGPRWLSASQVLADQTQAGRLISPNQEVMVRTHIVGIVKAIKPRLRRDITSLEYDRAVELWKGMGIFPRRWGEKSYNPNLARREFLRSLRSK